MTQVGRNDSCPCSSGKKYKKCCMNKVIPLDSLMEKELEQLKEELYNWSSNYYEVEQVLDGYFANQDIDEETLDFLTLIIVSWVIFSVTVTSGKTMVEEFVEEKKSRASHRSSVLALLEQWKNTAPSFASVVSIKIGEWIEIEDVFSSKQSKIIWEEGDEILNVGSLLIGHLLPFGTFESYFPFYVEITDDNESQSIISLLHELFKKSDKKDSTEFVRELYPDLLMELVVGTKQSLTDFIEWDKPSYQEVMELFLQKNVGLISGNEQFIENVIVLWSIFCEKEKPIIRKVEVYASMLHYFMVLIHDEYVTQKEIAEKYGVSVHAMVRALDKWDNVLREEIPAFLAGESVDGENAMLEGKDISPAEQAEKQIHSKKKNKKELKQTAADLIMQAYGASPKQQLKLIKQALELDEDFADAYTMLGDSQTDPHKALYYYEQGIEAGKRALGEAFFKNAENLKDMWLHFEARPFLRAKFNYGQVLFSLGRVKEAVANWWEILSMNEMDNQGVRYVLFQALIVNGESLEAKNLILKYEEEETMEGAYNLVLVEILMRSDRQKIDELLSIAKKVNPYVLDYLTKKKKLPNKIPTAYRFGSEEQAMIYVAEFGYLWDAIPDTIRKRFILSYS
ncbi:tetratricopeptide repeat protein [Radiobacillus deserti]|uniref:tetratricopeptide repeat protein n=1 Tax=Radiobacillus deserti TaxID=2594883 RepID=UPI001E4F0E93|nr:SEC-C metal-binding domain-containing protein [Radiobacillus deserti]